MHAHTRIMRTRTRIHQLKWANTRCLILYGEFTSAIHHCQDLNEFCANAQANKAKLVGRVAHTKQTHKAASLDNSHCFGVGCLTGLRHKISRAKSDILSSTIKPLNTMRQDIKGARSSIVTQVYPEIEFCFKNNLNFFELPSEIISLLCYLIKVFGYKQPKSQAEAGISKARSFYIYLKSEYNNLPF